MPAPAGGLRVEDLGAVTEVTIDRGPDNLMSASMCRQLTGLLTRPPAGTRIVHLRAAGPVFCLGRDRGGRDLDELAGEAEVLVAVNEALASADVITVAQVHGDAAGFGVGLAALCDLSFAAPSARMWFPEVTAGLAPTLVLAWLPRLVGRSRAFQLTATGEPVDGSTAAEIGLVTAAAPADPDLPGLVAGQIAALLARDDRAQREIRAFLRDSGDLTMAAATRLAVSRLTLGALRLAGLAPAGDHGGAP